jgi:hypothetical protein
VRFEQNAARVPPILHLAAFHPLDDHYGLSALEAAAVAVECGDGDLRYKLSKESAAKTLSLLMQTNFSGRAEIGLTGDDDFHCKVSPDGSTWYESFVVSRSSGKLLLGIDGSAGAPALSWAGDPDNGFYRTGANAWSLACAGAQAIGIGASAISIPYTTASTSTATGALTVGGGTGIAGTLHVGGNLAVGMAASNKFDVLVTTNKQVSTINLTSAALSDFSAGGTGIQISRPSNGGLVHAIVSYTGSGDHLAIIARTDIVFATGGGPTSATDKMRLYENGGLAIGSPTGGNKGAGTLNAVAVYDDNVLLTDYVFDKFLRLDNRAAYSPRVCELHDALDEAMFDVAVFTEYWRKTQSLYGMPGLNEIVDKKFSLGGMIQKLWQTAELQAIHIAAVVDRVERIERAREAGSREGA